MSNPATAELLREVIRPAVRAALRHGCGVRDLHELSKGVFVEEAKRELEHEVRAVNVSRISVVTGLQRRDVMRLLAAQNTAEGHTDKPLNILSRVIGQWQYDRRFSRPAGSPRALSYDGKGSNFISLVRTVSQDVHPGTVLSELERRGLVKRHGELLRLTVRVFRPKGEPEQALALLGADLSDLVSAVESNILGHHKLPHLHGRTEYTAVKREAVPKIRHWLYREGSQLHARARAFLSRFDADVTPGRAAHSRNSREYVRVVLGTFSFTEPTMVRMAKDGTGKE